jgi:hypothetical protein
MKQLLSHKVNHAGAATDESRLGFGGDLTIEKIQN